MSEPSQQPPLPSDEHAKVDPRLKSLLRRAGPIIAVERGLSETARVKIQAIAGDMNLPEGMYAQALQMLQNEPPVAKRELSRYEQAYEKSMRAKIQKVPRGILTAKVEAKAVEVGVQKYQLTELQAREIIRTLVGELNLQRISVTQAERHMENTIEDLVGDSTIVSDSSRLRLIDFGKNWGLSQEHVEAMIRHYTDLNLLNKKKESGLIKLLVACIVLVTLGIGGGIFYSLNAGRDDSSAKSDVDPETDTSKSSKAAKADFWDEELDLALIKAKLLVPQISDWQHEMADADPATRRSGYNKMLAHLRQGATDDKSRQRMESVLKKLIQIEPDTENVRALVNGMIAQASVSVETLPIDDRFVSRARWLVNVLTKTKLDPATDSGRAQIIGDELYRATGVSGGENLETLQRDYQAGLLETQLRRMGGMVSEDPVRVIDGFGLMSEQAAAILPDSRRLELTTVFVQAAIDPSDRDWKHLVPMMQWSVRNAQKAQLVQLIEAYETTSNSGAQDRLGRLLIEAISTSIDSTKPREIAKALRTELGVDQPVRSGMQQQREDLARQAADFIASVDVNQEDLEELATSIAVAAYWSTLASHIDSGIVSSQEYSRLLELGPPSEINSAYLKKLLDEAVEAEAESVRERPEGITKSSFEKKFRPIGKQYKSYQIAERVNALREISIFAKHFQDVPVPLGYGLATYILAEKNEREHAESLAALDSFQHWPSFLIGISDQLETSPLSQEQQSAVVAALLPEPVVRDDRAQWLEETRHRFLKLSVQLYEEIQPESGESALTQTFNDLESILNEFTRQRAINFGVASRQVAYEMPLTDKLRNWYAATQGGSAIERLKTRRDLQSADFLSSNALQESVMYQRLIIQQIAEEKMTRAGGNNSRIDETMASFSERNRQATNIAQQLLNNELTLLNLLLSDN